jgi:hypothetical protein
MLKNSLAPWKEGEEKLELSSMKMDFIKNDIVKSIG